jgi:[ribosomal protein S5]-alanine N-acetyltransferase
LLESGPPAPARDTCAMAPIDRPLQLLMTERLALRAGDPDRAVQVRDFYRRNHAHFAPWEPLRNEAFYVLDHHRAALERSVLAWADGTAFGWWLSLREGGEIDDATVIGHVHFSGVSRGVFHNAQLGYALDARWQGRGLITEALRAAITEAFSPRVGLHRIQAAYRPENLRSAAVLGRLGFEREGYAPDYLYIAGAWRDHVITALRNARWCGDPSV